MRMSFFMVELPFSSGLIGPVIQRLNREDPYSAGSLSSLFTSP